MTEEEKKSTNERPTDERYKVIELALSGIGVFAGVVYVLGRLHTEAYYSALGIAPGLLSFSTQDYMFSSLDLVVICAMASLYLYLNYYATLRGVSMFFWLPPHSEREDYYATLRAKLKSFWLPRHSGREARPEKKTGRQILTIVKYLIALLGLIYVVMVFVPLYHGYAPYLPGLAGLGIGLALGIVMLFLYGFVVLASGKTKFGRPYLIFAIGLLILVSWLPSISSNLAKLEAMADIQTLPRGVIISNSALIPQLQSSPRSQNESVEVGVITTNNDMTYLLKPDAGSNETWQVFRIQNSDIQTIIFAGNSS